MSADGFSALVPIPNGRGRHRAAPFGLGPWDGARVASQQSPILRPGQRYCRRPEVVVEPDKPERRLKEPRLIQPGCSIGVALWQLEIPPVRANSWRTVDAAVSASNGGGQQHVALDRVA